MPIDYRLNNVWFSWRNDYERKLTEGHTDQYALVFIGEYVFVYYTFWTPDYYRTVHVIKSLTRDFRYEAQGNWEAQICINKAHNFITGSSDKL